MSTRIASLSRRPLATALFVALIAPGMAFAETAKNLVGMFAKNFAKFEDHVDDAVKAAAPTSSLAA